MDNVWFFRAQPCAVLKTPRYCAAKEGCCLYKLFRLSPIELISKTQRKGNGDAAPPGNIADYSLSPFSVPCDEYPYFEICSSLCLRVSAFRSNGKPVKGNQWFGEMLESRHKTPSLISEELYENGTGSDELGPTNALFQLR